MTTQKHKLSFTTQLLGWIIIVLVVFVGIAATLEIAARVFVPNINVLLHIVAPTDDERHFALKPNAFTLYRGLYEKSDNAIEWRINAQGIRADVSVQSKSDDKFRIVTYGDSETFGWSVGLDDTWQQQMQKHDAGIEVINMGVPGYNIASITTHVEKTLPAIQPDLVIYLFNKNDVYRSLNYHPQLSKSYLYLIANMGLYQLKASQRKEWRNSDQGAEYFRVHLRRIIEACEKQNIPLVLAIQHWKYIRVFPPELQIDWVTTSAGKDDHDNIVQTVNVENIIENFPQRDAHLTEPAHAALAKFLCNYLASGEANRCRP